MGAYMRVKQSDECEVYISGKYKIYVLDIADRSQNVKYRDMYIFELQVRLTHTRPGKIEIWSFVQREVRGGQSHGACVHVCVEDNGEAGYSGVHANGHSETRLKCDFKTNESMKYV